MSMFDQNSIKNVHLVVINPVIAKILNGHESKNLNLIKNGYKMLNFGTNFHPDMLNLDNLMTVDNIKYVPNDIYLRAISINFRNLQCLDISELIDFQDHAILSLLKEKANSLKILKLPNCWLTRKGWLSLENWKKVQKNSIEYLKNFQQLQELQISNYVSKVSHLAFDCDMLSIVLSNLPNLKKLNVVVNENIYLMNENFEHLEWLELRVEGIPLSQFFIADICIHGQNLTTFVINGAYNITNDYFEEGFACYMNNRLTKLRCFRIKNCKNITKEYFEEMFPGIGIFEE